eukprot:4299181-Ditylum_brightwellii.AAC.1
MAKEEKESYKIKIDKWREDERISKHKLDTTAFNAVTEADTFQESEAEVRDRKRVKHAISSYPNTKHHVDRHQASEQLQQQPQGSFSNIFLAAKHNDCNRSFNNGVFDNNPKSEQDILPSRSLSPLPLEKSCSQG